MLSLSVVCLNEMGFSMSQIRMLSLSVVCLNEMGFSMSQIRMLSASVICFDEVGLHEPLREEVLNCRLRIIHLVQLVVRNFA